MGAACRVIPPHSASYRHADPFLWERCGGCCFHVVHTEGVSLSAAGLYCHPDTMIALYPTAYRWLAAHPAASLTILYPI